jgi:hypothetical protein
MGLGALSRCLMTLHRYHLCNFPQPIVVQAGFTLFLQAIVSTSFVSLQKAAAVARPNRWRTSILRDDAFLSTTAVVNEVPGPATCPVLARKCSARACLSQF